MKNWKSFNEKPPLDRQFILDTGVGFKICEFNVALGAYFSNDTLINFKNNYTWIDIPINEGYYELDDVRNLQDNIDNLNFELSNGRDTGSF